MSCMLTPAIEAALDRYRKKFGKEYPLELLPQEDEIWIVEQIDKQITSGRPARRKLQPGAKY